MRICACLCVFGMLKVRARENDKNCFFCRQRLKTERDLAVFCTNCLSLLTCESAFAQNRKVVALYPSFLLLLESSQLEFCTGSYVRLNMLCFFSFSDMVNTVHRKSGPILLRSGPNGLNESCSSLC